MFEKIRKFIVELSVMKDRIKFLYEKQGQYDLKNPKFLVGRMFSEMNRSKSLKRLNEMEFQVFSQFGDDGIIQYLIQHLPIANKVFIEFGVEDYQESNTRFLLINNNWSGLVIDASSSNIAKIKTDPISIMHDIHAECSFITRDNINKIIAGYLSKGYSSDIGILSIDIDGNDYWVWEAITVVKPYVVIIEYNSVFGKESAWTVPYDEKFTRLSAHSSHQYWGASIKALVYLGRKKGYGFIGCNSAGNNAYFIRTEGLGEFEELSIDEGFVDSKFREDIDNNGERISVGQRKSLIAGMEIFNVESERMEKI